MFGQPDSGHQDFKIGPLPARESRPRSESGIQNAKDAVRLVMRDVEGEVGLAVVTVVVGTPDELHDDLAARGKGWISSSEVYGWAHRADGSAVGIWFPDDSAWPDLVVSVADVIQEAIIEGAEHWGIAFPQCPAHPNHPMNAEVAAGVASWVCPKGEGAPIDIGTLHPTTSGGPKAGAP
jgi:hypothetical protein